MKPGVRSTEFYTTLLTNVFAILALFGLAIPNDNAIIQAVAVIGAALANAVYAHGRSTLKAAQQQPTPVIPPAPALPAV